MNKKIAFYFRPRGAGGGGGGTSSGVLDIQYTTVSPGIPTTLYWTSECSKSFRMFAGESDKHSTTQAEEASEQGGRKQLPFLRF